MNIIKYTGTTNTDYYSSSRSIKYIVLHYTAGTRSIKGSARNVASMFKAGSVGGSADFIVDDVEIVQYNGDIAHRACWAVGGSKYTSMSTSEGGKYYNKCTNANSVSIEMCSNKTNTKSLLASDTDWYLTEATINNAVELTKYLMKTYNIPIERVIMHHHVTGKICPNPWCVNQSRLSEWNKFKQRLANKLVEEVDDEVVTEGKAITNGKEYKIDRILKDNKNYIKTDSLANMGFDIGYNANTKAIIIDNKTPILKVNVNGVIKEIKSLNLKGSNYVSLRELAELLGAKVDYVDNMPKIDTKE